MGNKIEVAGNTSAPAPGIIPTSQVIVLKEQELDCDLATAIQRIRAADETAHSRILVVAPDDPEEVDNAPEPLPPPIAPTTLGQVSRRGEQVALCGLGARMAPLANCLERYLDEMRTALLDLRTEDTRAQAIADLTQVLDWTDALAADLAEQVTSAEQGVGMVDTRELFQEMGGQVETRFPGIRVAVGPAPGGDCAGRPADLAEAFFLGMALVAHRIGGRGSIAVQIERCGTTLVHRIMGSGEPRAIEAPECVARFRRLIVELHGGQIRHDDLGPGGSGLAIHLRAAY